MLVASADGQGWHRVKRALGGHLATALAIDREGALDALRDQRPSLVVVWSHLLGSSCEESVRCLRLQAPDIPMIVVTNKQRGVDAAAALHVEACLTEEIAGCALPAMARALLAPKNAPPPRSDKAAPPRPRQTGPRVDLLDHPVYRPLISGQSEAYARILEMVGRVAPVDVTILISGESGTGKEVLARWIHCNSQRSDGPFETVDLPAVPDDLFESILFGHERGAFTGAAATNEGKFQRAHQGTLFLDELSCLKRELQPKLLRALQEKQVQSVGARKPVECDIRLIAATNVDLAEAVERGEFRNDLYYRINVVNLTLPPLRERKGDIPALVDHFLDSCSTEFGCERPELADCAIRALKHHDWPGNIRELQNRVRRAALLRSADQLRAADLFDDRRIESNALCFGDRVETLERMEQMYVKWVLQRTGGNQTQAAQLLKIDRKTLRSKLQKSLPAPLRCAKSDEPQSLAG